MFFKFVYTFIVFILILQLLAGILHITNEKREKLKAETLYLDSLKTGDIFLVAFNNTYSFYNSLLLGQPFSHACMYVEEDKNSYIIEYSYYDEDHQGVIKTPFDLWLKIHKNQYILHKSLIYENDSEEFRKELSAKIMKVYETHKSDKMHPLNYFKFGFAGGSYTGLSKDFVCVEFISEILAQTDIRPKKRPNEFYSPRFYFNNAVELNKGYKYTNGVMCDSKGLLNILGL